jgi:hypothetical protein
MAAPIIILKDSVIAENNTSTYGIEIQQDDYYVKDELIVYEVVRIIEPSELVPIITQIEPPPSFDSGSIVDPGAILRPISIGTDYNVNTWYISTIKYHHVNNPEQIFEAKYKFIRYNHEAPVVTSFSPTSGSLNDVITITGENFMSVNSANTSSITFGGTDCIGIAISSDTEIYATVGLGTSGSIEVTNLYGSGSKSGFIYVPVS